MKTCHKTVNECVFNWDNRCECALKPVIKGRVIVEEGQGHIGPSCRISPSIVCVAEHIQVLWLNFYLVFPDFGKHGLLCLLHFLTPLSWPPFPALNVQGTTSLGHWPNHQTICLWGNKQLWINTTQLRGISAWNNSCNYFSGGYRVWIPAPLFGSVVKMSDWLLSEKDLTLVGGIAHICPVSEEDRMAAAKADLQMKTLSQHVLITMSNSDLQSQGKWVAGDSHWAYQAKTAARFN